MATTVYSTTQLHTKVEYEALKEGLYKYFGKELGLPDAFMFDNPWTDSHKVFKWQDRKDYLLQVFKILDIKLNIEDFENSPKELVNLLNRIDLTLTELETEAPEGTEFKSAEKPKNYANMPPKEVLEDMAKKGEFSKKERENLIQQSDQQVRDAIEQKIKLIRERQLIEDEKLRAQELQKTLKESGKKVYIKVTPPKPPPIPTKEVTELKAQAEAAPAEFIKVAEQSFIPKITNPNLKPKEKVIVARQAAYTTQQALIGENPFIRAAKIKALARDEVINKIITEVTTPETPPQITPEKPLEAITPQIAPNIQTKTASEIKTPEFTTQTVPEVTVSEPGFVPLPATPVYIAGTETKTETEKQSVNKVYQTRLSLRSSVNSAATMQMSQLELYKTFIDTKKIDGVDKLDGFKVEVVVTKGTDESLKDQGFEEYDVDKEVISPHIDRLNETSREIDLTSIPVERAKDVVRDRMIDKAEITLSQQIAKLPADSTAAKAFNHPVVQYGLVQSGLIQPTSVWIPAENSFVGNALMATGNGELGGLIQKVTGVDLGLIEVPIPQGSIGLTESLFIGGGVASVGVESFAGLPLYSAPTIAFLETSGTAAVAEITTTSLAGITTTGTETITAFAGFGEPAVSTLAWFGGAEAGAAATTGAVATSTATAATGAAAGTATSAATTVTTAAAGTAVGGATGAGTGAATGAALGGGVLSLVTAAIGAAIGWVASKINSPGVKRFINDNKELIFGVGAVALFFGTLPVQALGAIGMTMGGAAGVSAGGLSIGGALISIWKFFAIIGGIFMTVSLGLVWGFIGLLILVVLIVYIMNSGAYVVPQSASQAGLTETNQYVDVKKVASPTGNLSNPQTITYTVTITAKTDNLTNISINDECTANKKGGSINCSNLSTLPPPPAIISTTAPFTFTYTVNYNSTYQDSLVTDTITVNATSAAQGSVSGSGTATVCFGNCPKDCYNFPESQWPSSASSLKNLLQGASSTIAGKYPNFSSKACKGGTINICYRSSLPWAGIFAFHAHDADCDLLFNNEVTRYGNTGALYLLVHELTHHIQNISGGYVSQYVSQVDPAEPTICTYGGSDNYETMAEGNALFVAPPIILQNGACITNYPSQYPRHYQFARDVMFAP